MLKNSRTMLNMWKTQLFGRENKDKNGRAFPSRGRSAAPQVQGTRSLVGRGQRPRSSLLLAGVRLSTALSVGRLYSRSDVCFRLIYSAFRFMNAIIFLLILIMRYPALFLSTIFIFHTKKVGFTIRLNPPTLTGGYNLQLIIL